MTVADNRHARLVSRISDVSLTRAELAQIESRARDAVARGDRDAQAVLDAIGSAHPSDRYFVFMGFCPGADFRNRLDHEWRAQGNCTFEFFESEYQIERFRSIKPGDLLILKKRQQFGRTMRLYGYGRVMRTQDTASGIRILLMSWSAQQMEIEVPLLGCNDTVNVREVARVEREMPPEFWDWLKAAP